MVVELNKPDETAEGFKSYSYSQVTKRAECEKSFSEYFTLYYNQPFN